MSTDKTTAAQNQDMKKRPAIKPIDTKELEDQLKTLENELKRALADYRNLERRVEEERKLLGQLSSALVVEKLLPILDNLENAQAHLSDKGLEIVIKQFKDVLSSEGVSEIESEGQHFNPHLHEATEVTEGANDNTIVKVERKGYKLNDKVIRPAQVVVERKKDSGQARMTENAEQILNQAFEAVSPQAESVQDDNLGVNNG